MEKIKNDYIIKFDSITSTHLSSFDFIVISKSNFKFIFINNLESRRDISIHSIFNSIKNKSNNIIHFLTTTLLSKLICAGVIYEST